MSEVRPFEAQVLLKGKPALLWEGLATDHDSASAKAIGVFHATRAALGLPPVQGKASTVGADAIQHALASFFKIQRIHHLTLTDAGFSGLKRPNCLPIAKVRRLMAATLAYGFPAHLRRDPAEAGIVWSVNWHPDQSPLLDITLQAPDECAQVMRPGTAEAIGHLALRCEPPAENGHDYVATLPRAYQKRMSSQAIPGIPASATLRAAIAPARLAASIAGAATIARFLERDGQAEIAETIRREASRKPNGSDDPIGETQ